MCQILTDFTAQRMNAMSKATRRLRELMAAPGIVVAPGCYDALTARMIEQSGFQCAYFSGGSFSAAYLGAPDLALTTLTDLATMARNITLAVDIPVIADMEAGFGSILNVRRAVRVYEQAGIAGAHIEDQTTDKHCGHMEGKRIVHIDEMLARIDAALDARSDPDFVVIARTDAVTVEGFEAAIERGRRYAEAGADMVFVESPRSIDEIRSIPELIPAPVMLGQPEFGLSPLLPITQLEAYGVKLVIYPRTLRQVIVKAAALALREILHNEGTFAIQADMASDADVQEILGTDVELARLAGTGD